MRLLRFLGWACVPIVGSAIIGFAVVGWATSCAKPSKYRLCSATGYELVPGYGSRRENINSDGLRGAEIGPRQRGRLRILCMGESTTWGHMLADDETWPVALERRLRSDGHDVEVLNGGVSGWGLEQIVRALEGGLLVRLQPDVVLVFAGWNAPLLADNRQVERMREQLRQGPTEAMLHAFASALQDEPTGQGRQRREFAQAAADAFPRLLPELAAACAAQHARLALIRFPALAQRALPADAPTRAACEALLRTRADPDQSLEAIAAESQALHADLLAAVAAGAAAARVPLLDVATALEAALPADRAAADARWTAWFRDAIHFTAEGDAAFADALAPLLGPAGLLAPADASR